MRLWSLKGGLISEGIPYFQFGPIRMYFSKIDTYWNHQNCFTVIWSLSCIHCFEDGTKLRKSYLIYVTFATDGFLKAMLVPRTSLNSGHALGIWICGCSLFYKREIWASKSAGAHSTKSLKIRGCKRWCLKDLRVCAPAAPVLTHSPARMRAKKLTILEKKFQLACNISWNFHSCLLVNK